MSKFCKICQDSGKPSSIFRSHNIRLRGNVVCPTLLATECRFCKTKGHTPKFCPKLKERKLQLGVVPQNKNARTSRHGTHRSIPLSAIVHQSTKKVSLKEKIVTVKIEPIENNLSAITTPISCAWQMTASEKLTPVPLKCSRLREPSARRAPLKTRIRRAAFLVPWGEGPGEDEPFQRDLVDRIRKYGKC